MPHAADNLLRRIVAHHEKLAGPRAHNVGCTCSGSPDGVHSCATFQQAVAEAKVYLEKEKPVPKYASPRDYIKCRTFVDELMKIGMLLAAGLSVVLIVMTFVMSKARADEQKFVAMAHVCAVRSNGAGGCQPLSSPKNPFATLAECEADIATFDQSLRDHSGINARLKDDIDVVTVLEWAVACIDSNGVAHSELRGTAKVGGRPS